MNTTQPQGAIMNFTDRETYLAARAAWKANYKRISQEIRDARDVHRNSARTATPFWQTFFSSGCPKDKQEEYRAVTKAESESRRNLFKLRREANDAMTELADAKVKANEQWLRQREEAKL
jgi:hypothetical protein